MDCTSFICLERLDPGGARIFGFAEYLSALALIVVAWTIAERRYTFHLQTARLPVRNIAFWAVAVVGLLCLFTDIWRASGWPVPVGRFITPALWQGLLGLVFFAAFTLWIVTAFLYPPRFDAKNAKRFISLTHHTIVTGEPAELAHLADALAPSANRIVTAAAKESAAQRMQGTILTLPPAIEMLRLMADPAFCRAAVKSAPRTLHHLFSALRENPEAAHAMGTLATNVLHAAVNERASFLHRETADWQAGLAAQIQHLTRCLYGDSQLLDRMPMVMWATNASAWKLPEWQAYLRAARHTFDSYARRPEPSESHTVGNIFSTLESATRQLYRINGTSESLMISDEISITREVLEFVRDAATSLASGSITIDQWARMGHYHDPIQQLAQVASHVLFDAAHVTRPIDISWSVQYGVAWEGVFARHAGHGEAIMQEIRERTARIIWAQIRRLEYSPNYVGTRLLGLCINIGWVTGSKRQNGERSKPGRALLWLIHRWIDRNFDWLHQFHPEMAKIGFSELVSYLPRSRTLRKKWEPNAWRPQPEHTDRVVQRAEPGPVDARLKPFSDFPQEFVSRRRSVPTYFH